MNYLFFLLITLSIILILVPKYNKFGTKLLILLFLSLIIISPNISLNSAKEGLNLFLYAVFPSLFPFFIINDFMMSSGITENISTLCNKPIRFIFKTSGYGAYAFIISIFSGYPAGAKVVNELIFAKKISPEEGDKILTFSSTSGPLFIIGAVGAGMLKNNYMGYILYISHVISAIINGLFYNFFYKNTLNKNYIINPNTNKSINLQKAIKNSLITMGYISGYIVIFSVIINLLSSIRFYQIFATLLCQIIKIDKTKIEIIFQSLFEISNGCKIISAYNGPVIFKLCLISFILAFSGLSIIFQVKGVLEKSNISFGKYIISKLTHGIFATIVCYFVCTFVNINTFTTTTIININSIYLLSSMLLLIIVFTLNTLSIFLNKN
ncbi:MAG: hypothetical protein N2594_07280 [Clostridiales bacterium]|nr:hypothetical protein [Clostridiales bacterium]